MNTAAMFSSEWDDWNTPEQVLAPVRAFNGGPIGLDPCSNADSIVNALREYRLDRGEDGLVLTWAGFGLVFFNPPYGDEIGPFMRRADAFGGAGVEIFALVPNRTDTAWYQDNVFNVAAKLEWAGRLVHPRGRPDRRQLTLLGAGDVPVAPPESGSAPFPSAILYWGPRARRFEQFFSPFGRVWR